VLFSISKSAHASLILLFPFFEFFGQETEAKRKQLMKAKQRKLKLKAEVKWGLVFPSSFFFLSPSLVPFSAAPRFVLCCYGA
jgi:hypothetical protein